MLVSFQANSQGLFGPFQVVSVQNLHTMVEWKTDENSFPLTLNLVTGCQKKKNSNNNRRTGQLTKTAGRKLIFSWLQQG